MVNDTFAILLVPAFFAVALTQYFPEVRETTFNNPLFKRDSGCSIDNYQFIGFLVKILSFFERFAFTFLYVNSKNKFNPKQFGFQSNKNSMLQLLGFIEYIYRLYSNFCYMVFLDYSKSFYQVPFKILHRKPAAFGLCNVFLKPIVSYLSNRKQNLLVDGHRSDAVNVSVFPDGSVIRRLWFLLFMKELQTLFNRVKVFLWLIAYGLKLLFTSSIFHYDFTCLHKWNLATGMLKYSSKAKAEVSRGSNFIFERGVLENVSPQRSGPSN